jgi:hypothetical protein
MKTTLENKYKMYLAIKEFFATWIAVLNLLPHFTEFHTAFLSDLQEIQNLSEQQLFNRKGNGIGLKRKKLKLALIELASGTADKLYAYALFNKDQILQNEVHYTPSVIKQSSDATVLKWSNGIYERAELHLSEAASYGINDATLADLRKSIGDFEISMPTQRISATNQKLNTTLLEGTFTKVDQSLVHIDALVKILSSTEPILFTTYELRRKILNYGFRTMAIRGIITDSITKIGIKGVTIDFLNADGASLQPVVVKKSAAKGGFNIKTFAEGVYLIKMTKVGYNDLTSTHTIVNGELCKIFAEMIKI